MARTTKLVRLGFEAADELQRMCDRAARANADGGGPCWWDGDGAPSLGEMVLHLIVHMERTKERQVAARKRAADRRRNDAWETRYTLA